MSRAKQEPFSHLPPSQYSVWQREYRTSERQHTHTPPTHTHTYSAVTARRMNSLKLIQISCQAGEQSNWTLTKIQKQMNQGSFFVTNKVLISREQSLCTPNGCNLSQTVTSHGHTTGFLKKTRQESLPIPHASSVSYFTNIIKHASINK